MPFAQATADDLKFLRVAFDEAELGYGEGGVPIGSALVENGRVVARGHNRRVQDGDCIAHGEMDCLRRAGRRPHYRDTAIYTTLSPCMMCTGAILQFGIPRVVIGERENFEGNADFLAENGVEVVLFDDPDCKALMSRFIREQPRIWNEDIAEEV